MTEADSVEPAEPQSAKTVDEQLIDELVKRARDCAGDIGGNIDGGNPRAGAKAVALYSAQAAQPRHSEDGFALYAPYRHTSASERPLTGQG